jgi:hypothetical protein
LAGAVIYLRSFALNWGFIIPSAETLNRFVARAEANAHVEAVEEFYTQIS